MVLDPEKFIVNNKTAHPVAFEICMKEWEKMFSGPDVECPFKITDIAEIEEKEEK